MHSAAAFYMQNPELQRFTGGAFSTFRWKGLNNCQKNWAISLPMQMCDCQDMHTSKRQRASEQLKTYCFVLFCLRQTKCQPPQSWERVFAVNVSFAQSLRPQDRIWGSFPTPAADSLHGMGTVCSGQSFLGIFFLTLHAASCAWCTIQNMLFILCQTLTVATRRWFDFPVCNESQICPLPSRGTLQVRLSGCCVLRQLRKVQIVPFKKTTKPKAKNSPKTQQQTLQGLFFFSFGKVSHSFPAQPHT